MKKTPKEQMLDFVQKQYFKERDKWEYGMKNDYYHWEDLYNELTPYLAGDNYEIRRKTNDKTD